MATTVEKQDRPLQIKKNVLPLEVLVWHWVGIVAFGIIIIFLTVLNFMPIVSAPAIEEEKVTLPGYDLTDWRGLATQSGARIKPFETAAQEVCREIHAKNKVLGQDPVAVVISWMLEGNPKAIDRKSIWDDKAFILCEHQDIRKLIYQLKADGSKSQEEPSHEQIHGKYMSPNQLKAFREIWLDLEKKNPADFKALSSNLPENEFGQIFHRLRLYETIRQPDKMLAQSDKVRDPFAFVSLDKVPGSPWFSIGQLRLIQKNPEEWYKLMKERVKDVPQLYLSEEHKQALEQFEQKLLAGQGDAAVSDLGDVLASRRGKTVDKYLDLRKKDKTKEAANVVADELATWPLVPDAEAGSPAKKANEIYINHLLTIVNTEDKEIQGLLGHFAKSGNRSALAEALVKADGKAEDVAEAFGAFLKDRDNRLIDDLKKRLPRKGEYVPTNQKYRMLHLGYLETRFPDMYETTTKWQPPPLDKIKTVLASFDALCAVYNTETSAEENAPKFAEASTAFFNTLETVSKETSDVYPGADSIGDRLGHLLTGENINTPSQSLIDMELTFNRAKPFMWGWILMLGSLLFFCLSLGLNSRFCYIAGFSLYAISLAFQIYGFFVRIVISGRPPVSNMYETVIWVSFMTGIFALLLEAIYRRKVIALAGAFVATLGLVLADQLPLALDPKITSLVPVLRSNFWLTIHVITIVSSYAGGALAWGLGNIALILIVFGYTNKDTIKMLSNFTYRALQIAVLLLAAGTFLGGWWAAYSWGRFWGWDPKETGALIALVCYVIPLHMRFIGWIKDFGLAVSAIICFAAILFSWYGINFLVPAGLHAYAFGGGGAGWVFWAASINIQWVLIASLIYRYKRLQPPASTTPTAV